jgi:hypothetical protein
MKNLTYKISFALLSVQILLLISCGSETLEPYFEYDEVEHYWTESYVANDEELFHRDSLLYEVTNGDSPIDITDTAFILSLTENNFTRVNLTNAQIEQLRDIFHETEPLDEYSDACAAVYRDILIFRLKHKITGIIKLCFECDQMSVRPNGLTIGDFGSGGEFCELRKILGKNREHCN